MIDYSGKPLYDPRYVRLVARFETPEEYIPIPLHDCTEED